MNKHETPFKSTGKLASAFFERICSTIKKKREMKNSTKNSLDRGTNQNSDDIIPLEEDRVVPTEEGRILKRNLLIKLLSTPNKKQTNMDKLFLNNLIVDEITPILNEKGQYYPVKSGKIDRKSQKMGDCYCNSFSKMSKEFGYVEGVCINKSTGQKIAHAWNVDNAGNHLDFTLEDTNIYQYLGIIIPNKIVSKVILKRGRFNPVLVIKKDL